VHECAFEVFVARLESRTSEIARARPQIGYQVACDTCAPHLRCYAKISNPQPAPTGMNLKLFAVGQITSNQTSHLGNQTLRPRLR
jgi:hypothetical protein